MSVKWDYDTPAVRVSGRIREGSEGARIREESERGLRRIGGSGMRFGSRELGLGAIIFFFAFLLRACGGPAAGAPPGAGLVGGAPLASGEGAPPWGLLSAPDKASDGHLKSAPK